MTRHRLHSRVKTLERKARRKPLHKRWSWLVVEPAPAAAVEIYIKAHGALDRLRDAYTAVIERFERWRKRNPSKPGMPLKESERPVVGEALWAADYLHDFDEHYPHRDGNMACKVVQGDAEFLTKRPRGVGLIVWTIRRPGDLSDEERALAEAHEAKRKRRVEGHRDDDATAPTAPCFVQSAQSLHRRAELQSSTAGAGATAPTELCGADGAVAPPSSDDELRRRQARESFERRTDPKTRWRGPDHAPHADDEFKQARREGRVRVRGVDFLGSTTPRGKR